VSYNFVFLSRSLFRKNVERCRNRVFRVAHLVLNRAKGCEYAKMRIKPHVEIKWRRNGQVRLPSMKYFYLFNIWLYTALRYGPSGDEPVWFTPLFRYVKSSSVYLKAGTLSLSSSSCRPVHLLLVSLCLFEPSISHHDR